MSRHAYVTDLPASNLPKTGPLFCPLLPDVQLSAVGKCQKVLLAEPDVTHLRPSALTIYRFYGIAALILAVVFTLVASAHKTFAEFMAIVPFYLAAASALIFLLPGVVAPCPRPHLNSHYDGRWSATSEAEGLLPRTTLGLQDVDALVAAAARPISLRLDGLSGTGYPFMAQGHNVDHWVEAQARRQEILDAAIRAAVRETAVSPTSSSNSDVHSEGRTDRGNAQTSTHARTTPAPSESLSLGSVEPALPSQISSAAWPFFTGSAPPYWIPRITQGRLDLRSLGFWFDRRQNTDSSSIAGTSTRSPVPDAGHMC